MNEQQASERVSAGKQVFIGFPPPLLGAEPVRLPVLACGNGLLALNLPGGMPADAHPLNPEGSLPVAHALRKQREADKPELQRLGIETVQTIFHLEPECSGAALFGIGKAAAETWRNAYGSRLLRFRFVLICERAPDLPDAIECDLPLAHHKDGTRMLVSHKSGKKTATSFRRIAVAQQPDKRHNPAFDKELWEATTTYLRPHQIRLHAHEVGLQLCGESFYASVPGFYLSELKGQRMRPKGEAVLWPFPALHLAGISWVAAPAAAGTDGTAVKGVSTDSAAAKTAGRDSVAAKTVGIDSIAVKTAGTDSIAVEAAGRDSAAALSRATADPTAHSAVADSNAGQAGAPLPVVAAFPRPLGLAVRLLFGETAEL